MNNKVFRWFVTTKLVRVVGGTYTSYSEGKAEWKSSFRDGPLENLWGGAGEVEKNIFAEGKIK